MRSLLSTFPYPGFVSLCHAAGAGGLYPSDECGLLVPFAAVAGNVLAAFNNGWGVRLGQEHRVRLQAKIFAVVGTEVLPAARKADVLVQPCVLTESKGWYCILGCHWYQLQ